MFLCGGRIYRLSERIVSLKAGRWFDNNISMDFHRPGNILG
jgi:hypothetical protein